MTIPAGLAQIGFALESLYGAAVAPVTAFPWTALDAIDNNPPLKDQSWRGSAADVYDHETGVQDSTIALSGPVLPDSIGYLLAGLLGDVAFSAGTPNTFTIALLNSGTQQPPSYTVSTKEPVGPVQRAGCKVGSLKFTIDAAGVLKYDANLVGLVSTAPGSLTMPAVGAEKVMPSWQVAATIGGSAEPRLLSASVQLQRTVEAKRNTNGTQSPYLQRTAELSVTGALELAITTDAYRAGFLAGTPTSIDLNYLAGVGAAQRQLKLHCNQATFTDQKRSYGSKWVEISVSFEAEANTTDAGGSGGSSPVKVTLKNQVGSGVYK